MTIQLNTPAKRDLKPRIVVFGVGGAGGNAVNNMVGAGLEGVELVVVNTDSQALQHNRADKCIQIGAKLTQGLGAGSDPKIGRAAAEESMDEITGILEDTHMVFVTAGMGGGTGTGAAPIVARAAHAQGILTIGVVTKPFEFEGARRARAAEIGIEDLVKEVDTLLIIPNQNLFRIANAQTTFTEAFEMADRVLHSGVSGITDLMVKPGLINLDFADVRSVMNEKGKAMMGTGEAKGENRALEAAEAAIANPLLDDVSMHGARCVLINVVGGSDMTLYEAEEAASRVREEVDSEANIIFGATFDDSLDGAMRVCVVATGIDGDAQPVLRSTESAAPATVISLNPHSDAPDAHKEGDEESLPEFLQERPMESAKRAQRKKRSGFFSWLFSGKDTKSNQNTASDTARVAPNFDLFSENVDPPSSLPINGHEDDHSKRAKAENDTSNLAAQAAQATHDDAQAKMLDIDVAPASDAKASESKAPPHEAESKNSPARIKAMMTDQALVPKRDTKTPSTLRHMAEQTPALKVSDSHPQETTPTKSHASPPASPYDEEQLDIPAFLRRP